MSCVDHCGYHRWLAGEHKPDCPAMRWAMVNRHLFWGPKPTVHPKGASS